MQGGGCYKLVTQVSQGNHTFISKKKFTCPPLLMPQQILHQPSLQSCPPLLPLPSTCLLFLFPFLNGNHPWLPASIPKTLQLSAHISQIMSHWPNQHNLPQMNVLHSLHVI